MRSTANLRQRYAGDHPRLKFMLVLTTKCFLGHVQIHGDIFVSPRTVPVSVVPPCAAVATKEATSSDPIEGETTATPCSKKPPHAIQARQSKLNTGRSEMEKKK